jgi:hypothetical protein
MDKIFRIVLGDFCGWGGKAVRSRRGVNLPMIGTPSGDRGWILTEFQNFQNFAVVVSPMFTVVILRC